jgi:hypothetical protein
MTIEKGQPWGSPGTLPAEGLVVRSDAEARAIVERARRAGESVPPLGLLGGDLCRTVGGAGDEARLHSAEAMQLPSDLGAVLIDGRLHWFVAHLVARKRWWRGRVYVAMNAEFIGRWDVAPRGHPNDGRLDTFDVPPGRTCRIPRSRNNVSRRPKSTSTDSTCGSTANVSAPRRRCRFASSPTR